MLNPTQELSKVLFRASVPAEAAVEVSSGIRHHIHHVSSESDILALTPDKLSLVKAAVKPRRRSCPINPF